MLTLVVALLGTVGYYGYSVYSFANSIHKDPGESRVHSVKPQSVSAKGGTADAYTPPVWEGKSRVNVLLLGGDSRGLKEGEVPRSDTLMVASIDPVTKKAHLISILRDTYVKIPGHGEDRINSALAIDGPTLAMRTVGDLLGIPIQYYVYTDFKGFIALIDAVGGIDIDVEKNMKYTDSADDHVYDINLKKGLQHMDGKTALQYVRFRHDALSDFARTERQRKFMTALAERLQTTSSLIKLPRILQSIDPYIETNLSVMDMVKLGSLGFEAKAAGIEGLQVPPQELLEEKQVRGAEVIGVNPAKLQSYIQKKFKGESATTPQQGKVNAAGKAGSTGTSTGAAAGSKNGAAAAPTAKPSSSGKTAE
ncbi:LCP family protein [Paenibacillus sp. MBLB4367]|uniref:LCP family protein n=1 Tax=Paenibacillus sp. MBLB4367 TaxID=3384767 RepID=UPI003908253D